MMGIPPREAGMLTLWEYQGLLWNWNKAHDPDPGPTPLTAKSRARLERALEAHALH